MKLNRFSPFTTSQHSVLNSYVSLVANISAPKQTITVPSYRGRTSTYNPKENPLEDLPDVISSWTETARQLIKDFRSEKIQAVTDLVKDALNDGMGRTVTYDVTFTIDWSGDVRLESIVPEGYPTIREKSNYIGTYTEKITVQVSDLDSYVNINELDVIKNVVNQKLNIEIKADKERKSLERQMKEGFERSMRDHNERMNRGEYRDSPSRERMAEIGRMA